MSLELIFRHDEPMKVKHVKNIREEMTIKKIMYIFFGIIISTNVLGFQYFQKSTSHRLP